MIQRITKTDILTGETTIIEQELNIVDEMPIIVSEEIVEIDLPSEETQD